MNFSVVCVEQAREGCSQACFFFVRSAINLSFFALNWSKIWFWVGF